MQEDAEKDMSLIAEAAVYCDMRSHGNDLLLPWETILDKTG